MKPNSSYSLFLGAVPQVSYKYKGKNIPKNQEGSCLFFIYKAKNRAGRKIKGEIEAPTIELAQNALQRKGYTNIKVKPKPKDLFEGTFLEGKVSPRDMVVFSRQFSTMINAGVPILQSLNVLAEQTENKKTKEKAL